MEGDRTMTNLQYITNPRYIWKDQLPIDFIETTIVINTWNTVIANLSGGDPAMLLYLYFEQTNNGATGETIECEITINGTAYTEAVAGLSSGSIQYVYMEPNLTGGDFTINGSTTATSFGTGSIVPIEGVRPYINNWFIAESIGLIRIRQTSAVDVVSAQIEVNAVWRKLERV
jgi:hypothetical protein